MKTRNLLLLIVLLLIVSYFAGCFSVILTSEIYVNDVIELHFFGQIFEYLP